MAVDTRIEVFIQIEANFSIQGQAEGQAAISLGGGLPRRAEQGERATESRELDAETPEGTRLGHVTPLTRETRCTRLRVWCLARCPRRWPQQRHHGPLLRPYGPFRLRSSHELLPRSRLLLNSTNLSSKLSCATGSTKSSCIQHYFLGFSSLRGEHGVGARVTSGCYRSDHQQSHILWRRSLRVHYLLLYCANPMSRVSPLVFQLPRRYSYVSSVQRLLLPQRPHLGL